MINLNLPIIWKVMDTFIIFVVGRVLWEYTFIKTYQIACFKYGQFIMSFTPHKTEKLKKHLAYVYELVRASI